MIKLLINTLLIFISVNSLAQLQNPEIISRNGGSIGVKIVCRTCNGQKSAIDDDRKPCNNCNYWTARQREYNVCTVCRNSRYVVTKTWKVYCPKCKGKGFNVANISDKFEQVIKFNYRKMHDLGYHDLYVEKIIDKDNIVLHQSQNNRDAYLVLSSDNTLRVQFSFAQNPDFVPDTSFYGTWENFGSEDLVFRARVQKGWGNKETVNVVLCTQQNCSVCHGLGNGYWHDF